MNFCSSCGTNLTAIGRSVHFCPQCGKNLANANAKPRADAKNVIVQDVDVRDDDGDFAAAIAESKRTSNATSYQQHDDKFSLLLNDSNDDPKMSSSSLDDDFALALQLSAEEERASAKHSQQEDDDYAIALQLEEEAKAESKPTPFVPHAKPRNDVETTVKYTNPGTHESVPVKVTIRDARELTDNHTVTLPTHGFTLVPHETSLSTEDFYDQTDYGKYMRNTVYYAEMESLLEDVLHADKVFILTDQVRNNSKKDGTKINAFAGGNVAGYAGVVHTDYCGSNAVKKFYRANGIPPDVKVRYMLINTWRNISETPIHNNTLCVMDTTSVDESSFLRFDEPLKPGASCRSTVDGSSLGDCAEQYRLNPVRASEHRWYYYPRMTKNEVLLFAQFDSDPTRSSRFCFHSAFSDPRVPPNAPSRQSIEIRAMCIFIEDDTSWGTLNTAAIKHSLVDGMTLEAKADHRTLQEKLAVGARKGIIPLGDVEKITERAALQRLDTFTVLSDVCAEKGINYHESDWNDDDLNVVVGTGKYNVLHKHWDGKGRITSGLHRHANGVELKSDRSFVANVSPLKDERSGGVWFSGDGSITLSWRIDGFGKLETRYKQFSGKQKYRGTHFIDGVEMGETVGASVLEKVDMNT